MAELMACPDCGAAMADQSAHREWHREEQRRFARAMEAHERERNRRSF